MFRFNMPGKTVESTTRIEEASTSSPGDLNAEGRQNVSNSSMNNVRRRLNFTPGPFDEILRLTYYDARRRNKPYSREREPNHTQFSSACRGMPYGSPDNGFLAPSMNYTPSLSPNGGMGSSLVAAHPNVYFNEVLEDVERKIQNLQVSPESSSKK